MVQKAKRFLHDVKIELRKVHWPTKRELMRFTGVVLVVVFIIGVFFWILDTGFSGVLRLIL